MSDYLLYPNEYSFEHFKKRLHDSSVFFPGKYVLSGYPCNAVLYDNELKQAMKEKLGVEDKRVVVFMPNLEARKKGTAIKVSILKCFNSF